MLRIPAFLSKKFAQGMILLLLAYTGRNKMCKRIKEGNNIPVRYFGETIDLTSIQGSRCRRRGRLVTDTIS